ncbi:hypothetical protein TUM4644_23170 [Shewanella colwelliana]|uniref:Thiamine biosynthesis protein ThiS n=1 Tax=Shewanella colwelliana TaxID=23 RepID=A0A1E5IYZ1_SHECO|nr:sulfur carrier protein ThiS [Shewanella colwelliana]MDX1282252.1 sulfur carrier protein ThiS [Shewanella colwelliana]OEG75802.1 thiamine biosynthesis protein ThiS [Shewanella colwelliana]GIU26804.1 hypothetical protein TUM4644_23170 [Shewanella colwelliana]GIU42214.1 hypothetical protein TUM3794_25010 [Shewanella colwelliana]
MNQINIKVNGEPFTVSKDESLETLLLSYQVNLNSVALVRGGQVVPKTLWAITPCEADDEIELFGVVAGG